MEINTVAKFEKNIDSVKKLINFDRHLMTFAIDSIEELHKRLLNTQEITNPELNGEKVLTLLKQIRTNDSLKLNFSIINNQAVVLLVSYFSSAVAELFRYSCKIAINKNKAVNILDAEFKLKISEIIKLNEYPGETIGDLIINKSSISFQDMKSIRREFEKYFGIIIDKDQNVNNIILGHACRHSITHEAAIVNERVLNQSKSAIPRSLKENICVNQDITFNENEINVLSDSMLAYIKNLFKKVEEYENSK